MNAFPPSGPSRLYGEPSSPSAQAALLTRPYEYPPLDVPFTNQSAFSSTFTPNGFSFDSPFVFDDSLDMQQQARTVKTAQEHISSPGFYPSALPSTLDSKPAPQQQPSYVGSPWLMQGEQPVPVQTQPQKAKKDEIPFTYPATTLATGDRFLQLLEAKLGLAPTQPDQFDPTGSSFTAPAFLPPPPPQPAPIQSNPIQSAPSFAPGLLPSAHSSVSIPHPSQHDGLATLAIEDTLHDNQQITISPDNVARPVPSQYFGWEPQPQYQYIPPQMAYQPTVPTPQPPQMSFPPMPAEIPTPHTQNPTPPNSVMPPPLFWRGAAPPNVSPSSDLPPVLQIRVHNQGQQQNPGTQTRLSALSPMTGSNSRAPAHVSINNTPQPQRDLLEPTWSDDLNAIPPTARTWTSSPLRASTSSPPVASGSGSNVQPAPKAGKKRKLTADAPVPAAKKSDVSDGDGDKQVVIACHHCRLKKLKCDRVRPRCSNCTRRGEDLCEYDQVLKRRGPGRHNKRERKRDRGGHDGRSESIGSSHTDFPVLGSRFETSTERGE